MFYNHMNWFYTVEGLSKALNCVGFLAALLTCSTVVLKFRFDAVKKVVEKEKSEERSRIDSGLRAEATKARDEAIAAKRDAAEARSASAQRTITAEQREKFIESVKGVQRGKVQIWTIANDHECWEYSVQVSAMIKAAGYDVHPIIQTRMQFGGSIVGCWLLIKNKDKPAPHGGDIQAGLKAIGIDAGGNAEPMVEDEQTAVVVIGSKKPL